MVLHMVWSHLHIRCCLKLFVIFAEHKFEVGYSSLFSVICMMDVSSGLKKKCNGGSASMVVCKNLF